MILRRAVRSNILSWGNTFTRSLSPYYSKCFVPMAVRMFSKLPNSPIFDALSTHDPHRTAIVHSASQRTFSYGSLLHDVAAAKAEIASIVGGKPLAGERIAFLAEHGYDYVVTFLAILALDAIALPISLTFPPSEMRYIVENSQAAILLSTKMFQAQAEGVLRDGLETKPTLGIREKIEVGATATEEIQFEGPSQGKGGFMLYTSGTTNRPKGVLLSQSVLTAQARSLIEAWKYSPDDLLLHVLPLHHIHGTVNGLLTPLVAGSTIEFLYPFNPTAVWGRLAAPFLGDTSKKAITFLTVVPTIYTRLLSTHATLSEEEQKASRLAISPQHLRLNISGSAALPSPVKTAWNVLSHGNVLLERYGMTEVGMALSCGLDFADRVDGSVGWPLPSVQVRLVDIESNEVIPMGDEFDSQGRLREGEIQLRGPTIFNEYWNNPKATEEEFVDDVDKNGKWFKTGDIASRQLIHGTGNSDQSWAKGPMYFIKGRKSVDIIKTGGEKVSALEVERELLSLPQIEEAAVVGIESDQWGQKVAAVVVLNELQKNTGRSGKQWGVMDMRRALKDKLVNYKIPQELKVVETIPRNAMGKVNKKMLLKELFG